MGDVTQHAFLPFSGAAAWVECAQWPYMNARYPQADSLESAEGTASHWAFAEMLFGRVVAEGQIAPNGTVLNTEMVEGAEMFVEVVDARLALYGLDRSALMVERRIDVPRVHPHNGGTPDVWFYARESGVIENIEYKFGHEYVEAFENWQLLNQCAGIVDALGIALDGVQDVHTRFKLTVVQPRSYVAAGPVRTWQGPVSDLRGYFNRLASAAALAFQPDALRVATPSDACEHCPGRHACTALQSSAYMAADKAGASTPLELTPPAMALELRYLERALKRLEARVTGLRDSVSDQLRRGVPVPFYRLEATAGREQWNRPPADILALGKLFNVDVAKPGLLTPKQAIKAGLPEVLVTPYVERPGGGSKLVPSNGDDAAKVFR
jgi:hypothetical protein